MEPSRTPSWWPITWFVITLLLFLLLAPASAPAQSSESTDSVTTAGIRLIARPHGDSITLRWAPTDYLTWSELRRNGVVLERRISRSGEWESVTGDRLLAYSVEDFKTLTDTEDPHIIAVAEAMHGEITAPAEMPQGPMGQAKMKLDEQQQRFFLAAVNADLSAAASTALGWRWTDTGLTPGMPYHYRVRSLPPEGQTEGKFVSNTVRLRSNDNFAFGSVYGLEIREDEKKVTLTWPAHPNEKRYLAYFIETSTDGRNFTRTTEWPIVKSEPNPGKDNFSYEIEVAENYQPVHYRLVGINSFAEQAAPCTAIVAQGVDKTPPAPIPALTANDNKSGGFTLNWQLPETTPPDVEGFVVVRGMNYKGPFKPIHDQVLPITTTNYTDPEPEPWRSNYYAVYTYDTAGNYALSTPAMAVWEDTTPPAVPVGLTGRIDTFGNVFLMWEPGKEPDLHGYRVYVSHARNREFLQVTHDIARRNYYFDSTRLEVLNETVYYKIVALDNNFNPSGYSKILELKRPDVIPPSAAVITGYSARGTSVELQWIPSSSGDLGMQEIWRTNPDGQATRVATLSSAQTTYQDTTTAMRTNYSYWVRSLDEANLFDDSRPLAVASGSVSKRAGVIDLARTQVQGKDGEALRWETSDRREVLGYQLYRQAKGAALRPFRRIGTAQNFWPIPPAMAEDSFALQVIYVDGSRSALSAVVAPLKEGK
ncbi:MAG: hypothetical protein AAF840_07385 [Bacteroidota bacterium]